MGRSHLAKLISLSVFTLLVATGCRGCGEPQSDADTEPIDTGSAEPEQVDTGPSEEAINEAEETSVSLAVTTNDQARFIAGNVEAQETPEESAPNPQPKVPQKTTGSMEASELQRVFKKHSDEAQKCYERALKMDQNLAGRLVLTLTIDRNGSVAQAQARGDTLISDEVNECLERQARTWNFPSPSGGAAKVRKPFSFSPKQ